MTVPKTTPSNCKYTIHLAIFPEKDNNKFNLTFSTKNHRMEKTQGGSTGKRKGRSACITASIPQKGATALQLQKVWPATK
jgi:hypothetical protein